MDFCVSFELVKCLWYNWFMKNKSGFTLIEVSFFLAITGLLLLGVTLGVQNSIYQQRYNDTVQSFVEFLRSVYAETMNVQSIGDGRSSQAIYGKLVTFGEENNLQGKTNKDKTIFVYDVVGNASNSMASGNVLDSLKDKAMGVNVLVQDKNGKAQPAGIVESYNLKWLANLQKTNNTDRFKGALLVVRHPRSGTVYTFGMKDKTVEVSKYLNSSWSQAEDLLTDFLSGGDNFRSMQMDFCISPDGNTERAGRADVRIGEGARNSSAIETFYDSEDNECRRT